MTQDRVDQTAYDKISDLFLESKKDIEGNPVGRLNLSFLEESLIFINLVKLVGKGHVSIDYYKIMYFHSNNQALLINNESVLNLDNEDENLSLTKYSRNSETCVKDFNIPVRGQTPVLKKVTLNYSYDNKIEFSQEDTWDYKIFENVMAQLFN